MKQADLHLLDMLFCCTSITTSCQPLAKPIHYCSGHNQADCAMNPEWGGQLPGSHRPAVTDELVVSSVSSIASKMAGLPSGVELPLGPGTQGCKGLVWGLIHFRGLVCGLN